jgi:dephospho-CoA kinase
MKLVIITGMPGAGKSEVAEGFRRACIPVIVMGDVIRKETRHRGMEPNPENTKRVMLELREKDGLGAVAKRCVDQLRENSDEILAIEGCRSIAEVDIFDDFADEVKIVCVHTRPRLRFERLRARNREDAPGDWEVFRERDLREISVGLGGVIALSDIMIINEDTLESFQNQVNRLVQRLSQN